jgi:hypothetical protein
MEGQNSLSPFGVAVAGMRGLPRTTSGGTRADLFKAATFHSLSDSTFTTTQSFESTTTKASRGQRQNSGSRDMGF